jgi:hypothetical protein
MFMNQFFRIHSMGIFLYNYKVTDSKFVRLIMNEYISLLGPISKTIRTYICYYDFRMMKVKKFRILC